MGAGPSRPVPCRALVSSGLPETRATSAVSAAGGSSAPKPYSGSRPAGPRSRAVAINRLTTSPADRCGHLPRISAAVAATRAAAKLVPCAVRYVPSGCAPSTTAGAASTVSGPVTEPGHAPAVPSGVHTSPDTATTPGSRAGYQTVVVSSPNPLPVQAITTTSLAMAKSSASASAAL